MNIAIIGCGHIASKHAKAIEQIDEATLYAVCDTDMEKMQPYVDKYEATPYINSRDVFNDPMVELVCICTPSGHHASLAIKAIMAHKHVIVEKPFALTVEDADKMIHASRQHHVKLSVVHPNRFRPVVMAVKRLLDKGFIGKISHVNATVRWNRHQDYYNQANWRGSKLLDGGVLMNQAIHNLDLLVWFFGKPVEVYSMTATRFRHIEAEDVAIGTMTFDDGALGVVEAATTIYPRNLEETLSIFGEKGTIKVGGTTASFFNYLDIEGLNNEETNQLIEQVKSDPYGKPGHQWILEDMINAIETDRSPLVTGEDGKCAVELVNAFYQSAEHRRPIRLQSTKYSQSI